MDYKRLFDNMHPGFFDDPGIKSISKDRIFAELIMDLRSSSPKPVPYPCPENISFREFHGGTEKLRDTVACVDEEWVRYFRDGTRAFCAFDKDTVLSFCILEDWGKRADLRIGGPGCVGTVPEYRKKGIGLEMVRRATILLKEEGFDISWIHYTHLWSWYEKLGYKTVLRWTCQGMIPG